MLSQNQIQLITNSFSQLTTNTNFVEISSVNFSISANNNFNYKGKSIKALTNLYSGKRALLFQDTNTKQYYAVGEEFNPTLSERSFVRKYAAPINNPQGNRINYRGVFTIDTPMIDPTIRWPELQMRQRSVLDSNKWDWPISSNIFQELHTKNFYYWNGSTTSYITSHNLSEHLLEGTQILPAAGSFQEDPYVLLETISIPPGYFSPMPESSVNTGSAYCYYLLYGVHTGYTKGFDKAFVFISDQYNEETNIDLGLVNYSDFNTGVQDENNLEIMYVQVGIRIQPDMATQIKLYGRKSDSTSTLNWEIRLVRVYGHYLTLTNKGTTFTLWVNGFADDPKAIIKYFVGDKTLQEKIAKPSWDWRGLLLSSPDIRLSQDYETTAYYGDYYGSVNFSKNKPALQLTVNFEDEGRFIGRRIQRMFGFNPDTQQPDNVELVSFFHERFRMSNRDNGRWVITRYKWLGVDNVPTIKLPDPDINPKDLCIPPLWLADTTNGPFWQYPLFGAYYY